MEYLGQSPRGMKEGPLLPEEPEITVAWGNLIDTQRTLQKRQTIGFVGHMGYTFIAMRSRRVNLVTFD